MDPLPPVDHPRLFWFAILDGGLLALISLVLSPRAASAVRQRVQIPTNRSLRTILVAALAVHLGEALAAGAMARRRGLDTRGWALQTLIVGFPSLVLLARSPMPNGAQSPTITEN